MIDSVVMPLLVGVVFGFAFSFFNLAIPAPPTASGILGIIGIYAGYNLYLFIS